jgi:hypothetical protein
VHAAHPPRPNSKLPASILAALLASTASSIAHAEPTEAPVNNLLAGKHPLRSDGVRRAAALTDGKAAREHDPWKTRLSAVFTDRTAYVIYDLGTAHALGAAWLQADGNDHYLLEGSDDGRSFQPLWQVTPARGPGLITRTHAQLHARARYLRVRAISGDAALAISELQLFSQAPPALPTPARILSSVPLDARLRDKLVLFGWALLIPLLLVRRARAIWIAAALAVPIWAGVELGRALWSAWPVEPREVSLLRAVIAAVAAAAVARENLGSERWRPLRGVVLGSLGLCGVLGFLAFYNLGQPQFFNPRTGAATFAHHLDLRQYYPTAKYFRELGYRRIYDADIAAYLQDHPERDVPSLAKRPMRDLDTMEASTLGEQRDKIARAPQRFSPERWHAYKADARWFRDSMGTELYLETLLDYGGNATPVWMGIAHALFSWLQPDEHAFQWTGLIDTGLLLVAFVAIARSFGMRSMWVAMVVFGANDFIMYGTNWAGATLRHDWLAYIALGACALRRERWLLGGALLGLASMIRAFPVVCLLGVCLPALWRCGERWRETRRAPGLRELLARERDTLRVLVGAAVIMLLAFAVTAVMFPLDVWGEWFAKVRQVESDPHPAIISLRNLVADWRDQARMLAARWPVYASLLAFYTALCGLAARRMRPEQAALLALTLVPVWLYPSNYYLHSVFLWPLLIAERSSQLPTQEPHSTAVSPAGARVWLCLLLMCTAQYASVLEPDLSLHFYLATLILFIALTQILVTLVSSSVSTATTAPTKLPPDL